MAKPKATDHFDLLPYIAILMCTLGTLLLLTLSMTAINLGPGAGIGIVPTFDPDKPSKMPVLIEWDGAHATVHRGSERQSIRVGERRLRIENGELKLDDDTETEKLKAVLDDLVARTNTHYALFAVRPSGFSNFIALRARFDAVDIPIGYEPFEQGRPVQLLLKQMGVTNSPP